MSSLSTLKFQQEKGLQSVLPLGNCTLKIRRTLTTESTAVLMPFSGKEINHKNGKYYGLNALSNNMILFDRMQLKNPNGFILGSPGSGKSFSAKREMPNDTELKLSKAYVFKSGSNYFYCFSGVHYIEGIPLSTVGTGSTDEAHMNGVDFRIYIDEPNIIGEIRNFRYPYFTNKEEVKEIVSLESALSYLEDYLAPYGEYKISNISLEYCSKDNGDNGNSFTYHPTWCFTINKYQTNVYQLEPKRVLYLDAINKEVFCWDDVQFEFIFGDNIKNNMNQ